MKELIQKIILAIFCLFFLNCFDENIEEYGCVLNRPPKFDVIEILNENYCILKYNNQYFIFYSGCYHSKFLERIDYINEEK